MDMMKQAPLFAVLTPPAAAYLASQAQLVHYRTGEAIGTPGGQGEAIYVVARGWVQLVMGWGAPDGLGQVLLGEYGPGEVFGESALLEHAECLSTAIALEPVTCFVVERAAVLAAVEHYPSVARALLALLAARLQSAQRRIAQEVRDPLTNLPNRNVLKEFYPRLAARVRRLGGELAVVLLDVDRLKVINDTHGHAAGDAVLRAAGEALQTTIRATDLAVRYGGDEFVLVLPGSTADGAHHVVRRVLLSLHQTEEVVSGVSLSYGVAAVSRESGADVPSLDSLLAEADQKLYRDKERHDPSAPGRGTATGQAATGGG